MISFEFTKVSEHVVNKDVFIRKIFLYSPLSIEI